nr:uncharacterized protein LOC119163269 [Rhipicephalus microplus]
MQRAAYSIAFFKDLPFCQSFVHKVKMISCKDHVAQFELQLEKPHCNLSNTLHGGMATVLIDLYTCALLRTAYEKERAVLHHRTEGKVPWCRQTGRHYLDGGTNHSRWTHRGLR